MNSSLIAVPPCLSAYPCPPPIPPNNGWNQLTVGPIAIDGCDGCTITVTFSQRSLPCTGAKQLQMESFSVSNQCKACFSDGVLFQKAIGIMLKMNTIAVPQLNGDCIDGIEVVNVSCWKWTQGVSAPWVMSWCNTDGCCTINYKICKQDGELVIVYASNTSNYIICLPENGNECIYVCDWLPQVGVLAKSIAIDENETQKYSQNQINSYILPNPSNNSVTIGLNEASNGNYSINIINSLGEKLIFSVKKVKSESPLYTVDVSMFTDGIYIYQIFQESKLVGHGKFIVAH